MDVCQFSFTPTSFFDPEVLKHISTLSSYGSLIQIPCEHDQESDYISGEEKINLMIRSMLADLGRVLGEVQAYGNFERLGVQVMKHVSIYYNEMGLNDTLYSLNVFDIKGIIIAKGEYSRDKGCWKYKTFNPKDVETVVKAVLKVLEEIPEHKLQYNVLDKALKEAKIELPESLITNLLDSLTGEDFDDFFGAPTVPRVLMGFLEGVHSVIHIDGDQIVVEEIDKVTPKTGLYGVIVDLVGGSPREISNYEVAKRLYENKNYPFFQPNKIFLDRYDNEGQ